MELYIRNMVCGRCIRAVQELLLSLGVSYLSVELGVVRLDAALDADRMERFRSGLEALGFAFLDDRRAALVGRAQSLIVQYVHGDDEDLSRHKLSALLSDRLGVEYNYLSTLFSAVEGITIEKYAILQRIERVKELMTYDELGLGEIAVRLGYSSVAHLSQQFKKVTGLTPTQFRQLHHKERRSLDDLTPGPSPFTERGRG